MSLEETFPPDSIRLRTALFVSETHAAEEVTLGAFLPKDFWAPRPVEEAWLEAVLPRLDWDSDSVGRGPLSRKGLPVA